MRTFGFDFNDFGAREEGLAGPKDARPSHGLVAEDGTRLTKGALATQVEAPSSRPPAARARAGDPAARAGAPATRARNTLDAHARTNPVPLACAKCASLQPHTRKRARLR